VHSADRSNQRRQIEHHSTGAPVLPRRGFPVEFEPRVQRRVVWHARHWHEVGDWQRRVPSFGCRPGLALAFGQVLRDAVRHVQSQAIAAHMCHGLGRRHALAASSNHHSKFELVVARVARWRAYNTRMPSITERHGDEDEVDKIFSYTHVNSCVNWAITFHGAFLKR